MWDIKNKAKEETRSSKNSPIDPDHRAEVSKCVFWGERVR